jgi:hypothetical protein
VLNVRQGLLYLADCAPSMEADLITTVDDTNHDCAPRGGG